ncbi:SEC-C metal-binding domain-containing protein [Alkaliphilus serpentinus]|uniref:SEC-C motif-containing protein n=1 Tax=Alkaliphilus serpentinus TaxID=1482731 RepID=A0A833HLW7_9FIRM|nr:SEC-C metal-binding domain-containing protein [Alkaliphilus serpentinus]KAB3526718.1 hypothetical protein F8153_13565 [Alkaliphilus serpentinus]
MDRYDEFYVEHRDKILRHLSKMEKRLLVQYNPQATYSDLLNRLNKSELDEIRKALGIVGASTLKKQDLIEILEHEIPYGVGALLVNITDEDLKLLKKLMVKGELFLQLNEVIDTFWLFTKGLVFSEVIEGGKLRAFIPRGLIEPISNEINSTSYAKDRKEIKKLIEIINGVMIYYGALTVNNLYNIVGRVIKKPLDYEIVAKALTWEKDERSLFKVVYQYVSHCDAENPEKIFLEHYKREIPYYPITLKDIKEAAALGHIPYNVYDLNLLNYLYNFFEIDKEELDLLFFEGKLLINNSDRPNDIISYFIEQFHFNNIEETQQAADLVVEMYNNSKQWVLKGHSPADLRPNPLQSVSNKKPIKDESNKVIKISRNQPCPCGSGLKYKRCCGKSE